VHASAASFQRFSSSPEWCAIISAARVSIECHDRHWPLIAEALRSAGAARRGGGGPQAMVRIGSIAAARSGNCANTVNLMSLQCGKRRKALQNQN